MQIRSWETPKIAQYCQDHTEHFRRNRNHNPAYCFELFRRAVQESEQKAFAFVWDTYHRLVGTWLRRHPQFYQLTEYPFEFYLFDCFEQFVIGISKHDFAKFTSLEAILAYWKKCVNSVVREEVRKKRLSKVPMEEAELIADDRVADTNTLITAQIAWERIATLLADEQDLLLARLIIVQGLKPRQILVEYPKHWHTMRQLTTDIQRVIKRKLAEDKVLRNILGQEQDD